MENKKFDDVKNINDKALFIFEGLLKQCNDIKDYYELYFAISAELDKRKETNKHKMFNIKEIGEYNSVRDAALFLGISERSLRRWMSNGKIQYTKTASGRVLLKNADLISFIHGQGLSMITQDPNGTNEEIINKRLDAEQPQG